MAAVYVARTFYKEGQAPQVADTIEDYYRLIWEGWIPSGEPYIKPRSATRAFLSDIDQALASIEFPDGPPGTSAVKSINGYVGDPILDADDIAPTEGRLWLSPGERDKIAAPITAAQVSTTADRLWLAPAERIKIAAALTSVNLNTEDITETPNRVFLSQAERTRLAGITGGLEPNDPTNAMVGAFIDEPNSASQQAVRSQVGTITFLKWQPNKTYAANAVVFHPTTGEPLTALAAHTSAATFDQTRWVKVSRAARSWFHNVADYGVVRSDGIPAGATSAQLDAIALANAAAWQAAEDAASGATSASTSNQRLAGFVIQDPGTYLMAPINKRRNSFFLGATWKPGQSWREAPVRWIPRLVPDGGYLITSNETSVDNAGIMGLASHGGGQAGAATNPKFGFLKLGACKDLVLSGLYIENYGREAVDIIGGNHRISYSFFSGLFDTTYLTEQRAAVKLGGADHKVFACEFTGPSQTISSSNLYAAAFWNTAGASSFIDITCQIGDIGLISAGTGNRWTALRVDHNGGHGVVVAGGTENVYVGAHLNRNNRSLPSNTYDHIYVPPGGGTRHKWVAPVFTNSPPSASQPNPRYHINDERNASQQFHNTYLYPTHGDGVQTAEVRITNRWTVHVSEEAGRGMLAVAPAVTWNGAVTVVDTDRLMPTKRVANLTANSVITLGDGEPGQSYELLYEVRQDGIGGRTLSWAPNSKIYFPGNVDPVLNSSPNAMTLLSCLWLGDRWFVHVPGTSVTVDGGDGGGNTTIINPGFVGYGIAALGDSITSNGASAVSTFDSDIGHACMIAGVQYRGAYASGGATIEQIRDIHLPTLLAIAPRPAAVRVLAGTNNMPTLNLETAMSAYLDIINGLENSGIRPIICTIPPRAGVTWAPNVDLFNTALRSLAARKGYDLVDYHGLLVNPATGGYRATYGRLDEVHPDAKGYQAMGALLAETLKERFPSVKAPLADSNNEGGNLLGNLAAFLTDARTTSPEVANDGIPDGFRNNGTAGATFTRVVDNDGFGHLVAQVPQGSAGTVSLMSNAVPGFTGAVAPGDHIEFAYEITTLGFEQNQIAPTTVGPGSTGPFWYAELACFNGTGWTVLGGTYLMRCDVTEGRFWGRAVVPSNATGDIRFVINTIGSPTLAPIALDFSRLSIRNLSRVGIRALETAV